MRLGTSLRVTPQVEGVAARRGYHSSTEQTFDRILSTLLVEMDGVSYVFKKGRSVHGTSFCHLRGKLLASFLVDRSVTPSCQFHVLCSVAVSYVRIDCN